MVIKNKRGWLTILEATIAVMLVSGVLIIVYARQGADESPIKDSIFSLQKQILSDISLRKDLRNFVLEDNETALNVFAGSKVPLAYGYSLKVCSLRDTLDYCKLNETEVIETRKKDIFAEEIIVSVELNSTVSSASIYEPMKVRLYIWENR